MTTHQVTTKTATQILTDEVRTSPVDEYLGRVHARLLWILAVILILLIII